MAAIRAAVAAAIRAEAAAAIQAAVAVPPLRGAPAAGHWWPPGLPPPAAAVMPAPGFCPAFKASPLAAATPAVAAAIRAAGAVTPAVAAAIRAAGGRPTRRAGGCLGKPVVTLVYDRPMGGDLEFTISPDKRVVQIRETGYSGAFGTARNIKLGTTYSQ